MPELPEVETTLRGIAPHIDNQKISNIVVRNSSLRWPVPVDELQTLIGETVTHVCLLYTSPSPRDQRGSRMPSSA